MCNFKAKELLELRREIAKHINILPVRHIAMIIELIDNARHAHKESTGCNCWQEAINAAPPEFALAGLTTEAA